MERHGSHGRLRGKLGRTAASLIENNGAVLRELLPAERVQEALDSEQTPIRDCLLAVFGAIPYCIDLIEGPYLTTNENVVKAFRPKK